MKMKMDKITLVRGEYSQQRKSEQTLYYETNNNNMNEDIFTIGDLELSEMTEQEMEIIMNSIPDSRSFEVLNEVIRRFREKIAH